jgi:hypothetical protein
MLEALSRLLTIWFGFKPMRFNSRDRLVVDIDPVPGSLFSHGASPRLRGPGTRPFDDIIELPAAEARRGKVGPVALAVGMPFELHRARVAVAHDGLTQIIGAVVYVEVPDVRRPLVLVGFRVGGSAEGVLRGKN